MTQKINRYNHQMHEQVLNQRMRQIFERTTLEYLTSPQRTETKALLREFADSLSRWSDVTVLSASAVSVTQLAVPFLRALASEALSQDRSTVSCLRLLGKWLATWGRPELAVAKSPDAQVTLVQALQAFAILNVGHDDNEVADHASTFGRLVAHMLLEAERWLANPNANSAPLSSCLLALKELAEHHQDQRIMELAWATANMLDRLADQTLRVTDEFLDVVQRVLKLLVLAHVFQAWNRNDEAEYARTLEDADILASGGELKSLL